MDCLKECKVGSLIVLLMNFRILKSINAGGRFLEKFRSKIYSYLLFGNMRYLNLGRRVKISPGKNFRLGRGVHILDNSILIGDLDIGDNVFIHDNVQIRSFGYRIEIGENTTINRNTCILAQCFIGKNVSIAANAVIVGSNHVFSDTTRTIKSQGIVSRGIIIEDDVWIAANCTILDGVHIGKGSVVAAGAVVNQDVPPCTIVGGVPARILKKR